MGDLSKDLAKWAWGGMCVASFFGYTVEFAYDQNSSSGHHNHVGFIFLYIFILIFVIVGVVGAVLDQVIIAYVWIICWTVLVIVDALYVGHIYAYIIGQVAAAVGVSYAAGGGGGGGGGGK